jgi:hypothetical protein
MKCQIDRDIILFYFKRGVNMKKFWEWMEVNGYGYKDMYIKILDYNDDYEKIPNNMLIGYMLEYLRNHKVWEHKLRYIFDREYFKSNEAKTNLNKIEKIRTLFKCSFSLSDLYESIFHTINIVDDEEEN